MRADMQKEEFPIFNAKVAKVSTDVTDKGMQGYQSMRLSSDSSKVSSFQAGGCAMATLAITRMTTNARIQMRDADAPQQESIVDFGHLVRGKATVRTWSRRICWGARKNCTATACALQNHRMGLGAWSEPGPGWS